MTATQDQWAQWLLHKRHGGNAQQMQSVLDFLYPVRDKVLSNAKLGEGETLLDVGSGDGLIAFGALEKVKDSKVVFSDISQDLLDHTETLAREMGVLDRCRFLRASADDLSALPDSSLDAVTTRSVLIYVSAKQQSFNEFYRALKPGGRLSIFEPINRYCWPPPPHMFYGYDLTPVADLVAKVRAVYERAQPSENNPMLDFDERDMLGFAEKAGFRKIHMELQADIGPSETRGPDWDAALRSSPNPLAPTLEEAMREALSPAEAEMFVTYLRPQYEAGPCVERMAVMYLWATK